MYSTLHKSVSSMIIEFSHRKYIRNNELKSDIRKFASKPGHVTEKLKMLLKPAAAMKNTIT